MGTHPIFESDFDCLTERKPWAGLVVQRRRRPQKTSIATTWVLRTELRVTSMTLAAVLRHFHPLSRWVVRRAAVQQRVLAAVHPQCRPAPRKQCNKSRPPSNSKWRSKVKRCYWLVFRKIAWPRAMRMDGEESKKSALKRARRGMSMRGTTFPSHLSTSRAKWVRRLWDTTPTHLSGAPSFMLLFISLTYRRCIQISLCDFKK